jgi:hypothetical protein
MSKGLWIFPPPAAIKRSIKAVQEMGLRVTEVCVSASGIILKTAPATTIDDKRVDGVEPLVL